MFCDQSGFYLLPAVVRTYAPMHLYQSTDPIRPFCRQALLNWVIHEWHGATKVITTEIRDFAAAWRVFASAGLKGTTQ